MKIRITTISAAVILMVGLFTMSPLSGKAQIDENGDADIPEGLEIDYTGVGDYYETIFSVPPPPDPGGENPSGDPGVPVDGGLSLLLAAGLGYGANRLRKKREEKRTFDK